MWWWCSPFLLLLPRLLDVPRRRPLIVIVVVRIVSFGKGSRPARCGDNGRRAGTVQVLHAKAGDQVESGVVLVELDLTTTKEA